MKTPSALRSRPNWTALRTSTTRSSTSSQKIGEIVIGSLDGVELAATQPITITYTKVDGTWEPASSTSGDIAAALMTN